MGRKLAFAVYLTDPETSDVVGFLPGTEPPAWAAGKIGDHAYEQDEDAEGSAPRARKTTPKRSDAGDAGDVA